MKLKQAVDSIFHAGKEKAIADGISIKLKENGEYFMIPASLIFSDNWMYSMQVKDPQVIADLQALATELGADLDKPTKKPSFQ